jgi:hypothetical protein
VLAHVIPAVRVAMRLDRRAGVLAPVDFEPDACAPLIGIDRPTVGELVEEQQLGLRLSRLGLRARQPRASAQLNTYHLGGHPDAQLEWLLRSAFARLLRAFAQRHGARDELAGEQHDYIPEIRGGPVHHAHAMAGGTRRVAIGIQRDHRIRLWGLRCHVPFELPTVPTFKPNRRRCPDSDRPIGDRLPGDALGVGGSWCR